MGKGLTNCDKRLPSRRAGRTSRSEPGRRTALPAVPIVARKVLRSSCLDPMLENRSVFADSPNHAAVYFLGTLKGAIGRPTTTPVLNFVGHLCVTRRRRSQPHACTKETGDQRGAHTLKASETRLPKKMSRSVSRFNLIADSPGFRSPISLFSPEGSVASLYIW